MQQQVKVGATLCCLAVAILLVFPGKGGDLGAQAPAASALAQYPGFGHNPAADEARYVLEQRARLNHIARCMATRGFTYHPVEPQTNPVRTRMEGEGPAPDPNARIAASLAPDARLAYYRALYGVDDPNDPFNLWDPSSESGGGCWGDALRTIPGVYAARSALAEEFAQMRMSVFSDPQVVTADQAWAQCMRTRGHRVSSVRDPLQAADPERAGRDVEECRRTSGISSAIDRATVARENEFVLRHRPRLDALRARIEAQPAID